MWILNNSRIDNLTGTFESGTDFTIANLQDNDIGVYAKSSGALDPDGVLDTQLLHISFTTSSLSCVALLNINSFTNRLDVRDYTNLKQYTISLNTPIIRTLKG